MTTATPSSAPAMLPLAGQRRWYLEWHSPWFLVLVVSVAAILLRAVYAIEVSQWPDFSTLRSDSLAYDSWAQSIRDGDVLGKNIGVFYQAPLYPYLLAVLYTLPTNDLLTVRIVQVMFGAAACAMVGLATRRFFPRLPTAGIVAGLMLACYPPAMFFDLQIDKTSLDQLLLSAMIWLIAILTDIDSDENNASPWWFLTLGVVNGLLTLTRENSLALAVVIIAVIALQRRKPVHARLCRVGLILAGLAIVLLPVAARNRVVGGEWHLTTAQFGPNFYIGNNATADGLYTPLKPGRGDARYERTDAVEIAEQAAGHSLSPGEVSTYWTRRTLEDIADHPANWITLTARKSLMIWTSTEVADSGDFDTHAAWSLLLAALDRVWHFGVLLPLAAAGVVLTWGDRRRLLMLYALIATYAGAIIAFCLFARYRYPLVPMLAPLAGAAIVSVVGAFIDRPRLSRGRIFVAVAVAIVTACVSNATAILPRRIRGADAYNRALAFDRRAMPTVAERWYLRAIRTNPHLDDAIANLGLLYLSNNHLHLAIAVLQDGVLGNPSSAPLHNNLGLALAQKDDVPHAIVEFTSAANLDPEMTQARLNLGIALSMMGRDREAAQALRTIRLDEPGFIVARNTLDAIEKRHPEMNVATTRKEDAAR